MKQIISSDNQAIKLARSLHHKKYRDQEQLFLVEGRRSVQEALARPELIHMLFLLEDWADEYSDLQDIDCYILDAKMLKHISATETQQGLAAILRKPVCSLAAQLLSKRFLVLLDRVADPGNLGSIIRSCWALGVDGLLLTAGCVDPYSPKVVRSTMGGILHLPIFEGIAEAELDLLQAHGYELIATGLEDAQDYYDIDMRGAKLLVLGNEAEGINPALKSRCSRTSKIPINIAVDSLNVAAACAIITAEAWRQRNGRSVSKITL